MDLNKIKKIYFIGIEGAGTSALARLFKAAGKEVSGSDEGDHFYNDQLRDQGIEVYHEFDKGNIPLDADLIIHSAAFRPETNPEMAKAVSLGVKMMNYGEALGILINQRYSLAVCGSHGKTTTTAWLAFMLDRCGLQPSALVGSKVPQFNGNTLIGRSDYFVVETDEYKNKLQYYQPKAVLLNNIDYDHPDFFPTRESYEEVFVDFIKKIPTKGFLVANYDDPIIRSIAGVNCRGKVISYAIDEAADYVAFGIKQEAGKQFFKVKFSSDEDDDHSVRSEHEYEKGEYELGDFSISLMGRHNILNTLAVIATCIELGVELVDIRKHLDEFSGTARRAEIMGKFRSATILNDYAHHPTEVRTTLEGIRQSYTEQLKDSKLRVIFHPHTFTRTKALLSDFAKSFGAADEVIILDIYGSAREIQGGIHSRDLVEAIQHENKKTKEPESNIKYIPTLKEVEEYLRDNIESGDVIVLMGAGDAYKIGEKLVN